MDLREIASAYQSVYLNEEVEEDVSQIIFEDLSQEEVDDFVGEIIDEFLEEGFSAEDIEEAFDEYIDEQCSILTEARRAKRQPGKDGKPQQGSFITRQREKLKQQQAAKKDKVESDKAGALARSKAGALMKPVKVAKKKGGALAKSASGAITKAVEKVKVKVHDKDTKSLPAGSPGAGRKETATSGGIKSKGGAMGSEGKKGTALPAPKKGGAIVKRNETIGAKTTPKQQAAAKAKETVKTGVGYALKKRDMKRGNRRTVLDPKKKTTVDKLKDKASSVRVDVTNAAKGLKRKAGKALGKLASKLSEEGGQLDSFDTVVAYLIDEEIASDFDEATKKMAKLSEATVAKIHASQLQLLDEAVYGGGKKEEKKDTRMTVTNADKKGNTPAYQNYMKGDKRYKAADHMKGDK